MLGRTIELFIKDYKCVGLKLMWVFGFWSNEVDFRYRLLLFLCLCLKFSIIRHLMVHCSFRVVNI